MDELISRRDTISAMEGTNWYHINSDGQLVHGANSKDDEPLYKAKDVYAVLNTMPSAQPEKRTEERTETHGVCLDAIDRQATIDALEKVAELFPWRVPGNRDSYDRYNEAWNDAIGRAEIEIEKLPSAQPEIVLCKECSHRDEDGACDQYNDGTVAVSSYVPDEHFCSWGERKTDERQT